MFRFGQKNEKGEQKMQKMQKIIGLLLILGMAVTAIAIPNIAEAADDAFTITVTISYLETKPDYSLMLIFQERKSSGF